MNAKADAVLTRMLGQFRERHAREPKRVVVAPLACLALAIKGSVAPSWMGIPVECREIREEEATVDRTQAQSLGVFVLPEDRTARIVCCDLKT